MDTDLISAETLHAIYKHLGFEVKRNPYSDKGRLSLDVNQKDVVFNSNYFSLKFNLDLNLNSLDDTIIDDNPSYTTSTTDNIDQNQTLSEIEPFLLPNDEEGDPDISFDEMYM